MSAKFFKCPYGQIGDLLWVRETWAIQKYFNGLREECFPIYKTDYPDPVDWKWKPSIYMPKSAARIWLQITDIKVERLQDITEADALKEGCQHAFDIYQPGVVTEKTDTGYIIRNAKSFRSGFMVLWNKINGEDAWRNNPWVWVISFKVLSSTGRPSIQSLNYSVVHLIDWLNKN
jgi:hypothetical protein